MRLTSTTVRKVGKELRPSQLARMRESSSTSLNNAHERNSSASCSGRPLRRLRCWSFFWMRWYWASRRSRPRDAGSPEEGAGWREERLGKGTTTDSTTISQTLQGARGVEGRDLALDCSAGGSGVLRKGFGKSQEGLSEVE